MGDLQKQILKRLTEQEDLVGRAILWLKQNGMGMRAGDDPDVEEVMDALGFKDDWEVREDGVYVEDPDMLISWEQLETEAESTSGLRQALSGVEKGYFKKGRDYKGAPPSPELKREVAQELERRFAELGPMPPKGTGRAAGPWYDWYSKRRAVMQDVADEFDLYDEELGGREMGWSAVQRWYPTLIRELGK